MFLDGYGSTGTYDYNPLPSTVTPTYEPGASTGFWSDWGSTIKASASTLLDVWGNIKGAETNAAALQVQSDIERTRLEAAKVGANLSLEQQKAVLASAERARAQGAITTAQAIGGKDTIFGMSYPAAGLLVSVIGVVFAAMKAGK